MVKQLLDGLKLIDYEIFCDERGSLLPLEFEDISKSTGCKSIVQANITNSKLGVIRGMHWQSSPFFQGKFIVCLSGKIVDIALDIRPSSSTFGSYFSVNLSGEERQAFWIPAGFAHGFQTVSNNSTVAYLVDAPFNLNASHCIHPLDKDLNLPWDNSIVPILSKKDADGTGFNVFLNQ